MVSVIITANNERFLTKTVEDLLNKALGKVEIIINLNGGWPDPLLPDKRVVYIHPGVDKGMRWGINAAAALARGEYLMKTDGHCMFAEGFDKTLIENHLEDNWVQVPRRYSLDAESWKINENRPYRDYLYLSFPVNGDAMKGVEWWQRQNERNSPRYDIDDTPSMQGSCWFMTKNHFDNFLHGLSEEGYGTFSQEAQEIGNKTWLGGGALKVNKKTWYAHLHKGKRYGRMYHVSRTEIKAQNEGVKWSADYWMNNRWPERLHDIAWLVDEKFPGMPNWPNNWKELYYGSS